MYICTIKSPLRVHLVPWTLKKVMTKKPPKRPFFTELLFFKVLPWLSKLIFGAKNGGNMSQNTYIFRKWQKMWTLFSDPIFRNWDMPNHSVVQIYQNGGSFRCSLKHALNFLTIPITSIWTRCKNSAYKSGAKQKIHPDIELSNVLYAKFILVLRVPLKMVLQGLLLNIDLSKHGVDSQIIMWGLEFKMHCLQLCNMHKIRI